LGIDKVLIDTHVLLWWWSEPDQLSSKVVSLLQAIDIDVYVSAVSAWEISTKTRIGKLPIGNVIIPQWHARLDEDDFFQLDINSSHSLLAGSLESPHRDPFDRMLGAQSILEELPLISRDEAMDSFGLERIW